MAPAYKPKMHTKQGEGTMQSEGSEPMAWAVLLADGRRIYDVYGAEEEAKAISESVAGNHGIAPLYRSPVCPYVTGTVTRYCTLTPFTLTDKEREAIVWCVEMAATIAAECDEELATLRGLLERTDSQIIREKHHI